MSQIIRQLEKNLKYNYQIEIYNRLQDNFDLQDVECLGGLYRLLFNIYIESYPNIDEFKEVVSQLSFENIEIKDGEILDLVQVLKILKFILSENIETRIKLFKYIERDLNNDKIRMEKLFKRVIDGVRIQDYEKKLSKIDKNDKEQIYFWNVEFLIAEIHKNIYEFKKNLENFEISNSVVKKIKFIQSLLPEISSIEG